jgi:hypothetical protein
MQRLGLPLFERKKNMHALAITGFHQPILRKDQCIGHARHAIDSDTTLEAPPSCMYTSTHVVGTPLCHAAKTDIIETVDVTTLHLPTPRTSIYSMKMTLEE